MPSPFPGVDPYLEFPKGSVTRLCSAGLSLLNSFQRSDLAISGFFLSSKWSQRLVVKTPKAAENGTITGSESEKRGSEPSEPGVRDLEIPESGLGFAIWNLEFGIPSSRGTRIQEV